MFRVNHVQDEILLIPVIGWRHLLDALYGHFIDVGKTLHETRSLTPPLLAIFVQGFLTLDDRIDVTCHDYAINHITSSYAP